MSWTFTADDGDQVHYDVPPQVAELEQQLAVSARRIETEMKIGNDYLEELAALREAAQAVVDSAGNWIHEAQHSDDLVKLAALLREKGE